MSTRYFGFLLNHAPSALRNTAVFERVAYGKFDDEGNPEFDGSYDDVKLHDLAEAVSGLWDSLTESEREDCREWLLSPYSVAILSEAFRRNHSNVTEYRKNFPPSGKYLFSRKESLLEYSVSRFILSELGDEAFEE